MSWESIVQQIPSRQGALDFLPVLLASRGGHCCWKNRTYRIGADVPVLGPMVVRRDVWEDGEEHRQDNSGEKEWARHCYGETVLENNLKFVDLF